jgi:hypothetical protein
MGCLVTLVLLGSQPMLLDARFRNAIESGNGDRIYTLSSEEPKSYQLMYWASNTFFENSKGLMARYILKTMLRKTLKMCECGDYWRRAPRQSRTEI